MTHQVERWNFNTGSVSTVNERGGLRWSLENIHQKSLVVIPVDWGQLSIHTFRWYLDNIHKPENLVCVCHVPDFRSRVKAGMSEREIWEHMKEVNVVSGELKKMFEDLIHQHQIDGRFVRITGNNRWSAIVEYGRRMNAAMIVMGTRTLLPSSSPTCSTLLSSITLDVLMHSLIPVVIVRMPRSDRKLSIEEKEALWKGK